MGLDRYSPGHNFGSSHGQTRIIRFAYFEGPEYVPLIRRSLDLILQLEREVGQELFYNTGVLDIGDTFEPALVSVMEHDLTHEILSGNEVKWRFQAGEALPLRARPGPIASEWA
eukprot:gene30785-35827_t